MAATKRPKRSRINLRIPAELASWAKGWAKKRNTTVTQVIVDFLTTKKEEANASNPVSR